MWDGNSKAVKEIKSGGFVVCIGKRVNANNNARQDKEKGEGMSFDTASCAEVKESVGTLEVSC